MAPPDPLRRVMEVIVPRAVESIDVNEVVEEIDVDQVLARVDLDAVLARIDMDALLARIDVPALLERIDLDAMLDRVDVERLMERIDIAEVVKRAEVAAIISATAGGLGNRLLDLVRRQLVGLDIVLTRIVDRLFRRRVVEPVSRNGSFTGEIAGGATRMAAFLMDLAIVALLFAGLVAVTFFLAGLFAGHNVSPIHNPGLWRILAFLGLAGFYQWVGLVIAGRTIGRALAGLRVTAPDGTALSVRAATRRWVVYPFSFILGLGLIGIVTSRRHRALHDVAAPSVVRYDWGDRPAEMPGPLTSFLNRQGVDVRPPESDHPAAPAGPIAELPDGEQEATIPLSTPEPAPPSR